MISNFIKTKYFFMIIITIVIKFSVFSDTNYLIVNKLAQLLIQDYDCYKNKTFLEKMILKFGRSAFVDSVNIWKDNYLYIDRLKIKLHPRLDSLVQKVNKYSNYQTSQRLKDLLEQLTHLAYKNLQFYYIAILESDKNISSDKLTVEIVTTAITNSKFYSLKRDLYAKEDKIKLEVKEIISSKKLKHKLSFYNFVFDFLNKIRTGIIEKDLEKMRLQIIGKNKIQSQFFSKKGIIIVFRQEQPIKYQ